MFNPLIAKIKHPQEHGFALRRTGIQLASGRKIPVSLRLFFSGNTLSGNTR
jgi:hypothetical protein